MELYWGEPEDKKSSSYKKNCADKDPQWIEPLFKAFPELQFRLDEINADDDEYRLFIYENGSKAKHLWEDIEDREKYDIDLYQWLEADFEETFPFSEALKYIPAKNWNDKEFCARAVTRNGLSLEFVPDKLKTLELSIIAVSQNRSASDFVPEAQRSEIYRDKDLCLKIVTEDGNNIKHIPQEYHSEELWLAAIEHGLSFADTGVPEEYKTARVCEALIAHTETGLDYVFNAVPEALRTKELCLMVAEKANDKGMHWTRFLEAVPESCMTHELLKIACSKDGEALRFVPESQRTPELCLLAARNSGFSSSDVLESIPKDKRTQEIYDVLVQSGMSLELCRASNKRKRRIPQKTT